MTKSQAGHNGLGYLHVGTITVNVHPPYLLYQEICPGAKAQWVLTDLINMAKFLESHIPSDGNKYKNPVLKSLTDYLNDRIVIGRFKKLNGVKQKLADGCQLKTCSGSNWDDDFSANIITQTEAEVWESLV
ncbi:hypothetical protein B0H17DRAFT_928592, partial [Mycena rosella]